MENRTLLDVLEAEKARKATGGIYHKIQIELTYNSNHIEGSRLTHDQTRYIFETNTVMAGEGANVDDILETANHFHCMDIAISQARKPLTERIIKQLHKTLKSGTSDNRRGVFLAGEYKRMPNEVGGRETAPPEEVGERMKALLDEYNENAGNSEMAENAMNEENTENAKKQRMLEAIIDFHAKFERIHPFQDGNGRVGRLVMFKECLRASVVPFIIADDKKMFYYRGLNEWGRNNGFLLDTCRAAQDEFKKYLDYFRIEY